MILDDIVAKKKETLKEYKFPQQNEFPKIENFYNSLAKQGLSIIGEIKKASPSKGIIKANFNPTEIAKQYELSVDAISVLTEEKFFLGKAEYLEQVHNEVKLPIIRKDFIIDKRQILEARIIGASAILLIVSILNKAELKQFLNYAKELELDCLVETHNKEELHTALEAGAEIIGVNNRDLKTFKVDLNTTIKLRDFVPEDKIFVAESGINTIEDIKFLKQTKLDAILVGESFMRTDNINEKAKEFKKQFETGDEQNS